MKAEIIAVGTELLLGQILNTNAQYMAQELADLGVDVYFQGVVGDNMERVKDALSIASARSDLIVCCGGLGPTDDDLTKDAIAEFTGAKLVLDPDAEAKILELFKDRHESLVAANKRQANTIEGSQLLKNDVGLAVGFLYQHQQTYYAVLPGPPREMKYMFEHELKPVLDELLGDRTKLYSKYLKFGGIGESTVADSLKDLISNQGAVSVAPYANIGEVTVRLSVKANSEQQAEAQFIPVIDDIKQHLADHLYSEDNESLEQVLGQQQIADFGVLEVNTTAYLTHKVLHWDDANDNVQLSAIKRMQPPLNQQMVEDSFAQFVNDGQLSNAIGLFHCHDLPSASTASGKTTKTFFIGLCVNGKTSVIERAFIGDRQAVHIRAAKTAIYLFLQAYKS
ncbi:CinA family nicotinamide mononucleotide deamidase-related protein [Psychrobacter sp. FDAARGOS_221]|uniref:CinA family nicotinamide mononucleotide deamidase-related protein n=1 Tax=Psychrobacter sp. FDAARGOS_221 TaxID=1975705 RepID=UPI000BB543A4|nr:CinA family nicotinamide mononucleotide deamidase-related protein [Psychrobacter sp. FDAARGOS_221]PNK59997.1 competence/damage-inducible protein A [Psychrobacter sp. FDAARGOS_221]